MKWTKEQIEEHIKINVKDYGAMVVVSALFKKLYGVHPKIGLSGFQAQGMDAIVNNLPDALAEAIQKEMEK